ncbi:hypothetical protein ES319_A05G181000v1 [Gossypium barbadense]|uniref:Peroxidase n=3 Tax=Gossypium TaxID=3633 RepID=A0ABM3BRF9_GOSHI|nr:peroxidase 29-like isoform X1 [Gossypium hirsutum]KAB2082176.1 hypothetical protein ES319_A05G181000v1 [Gossypium barbadense]TYI27588.1 hypothetical protein ES332_A05G187400v1 [Gossypium tomentosum]
MRNHACFMLFVKVALGMGILVGVWEAQLDYDYYKSSCPDVENTVRKAVLGVILTDPTAPAAFLRLLFHDCQVQGCDASILLDSKPAKGNSEMASGMNLGIRRLETIHSIKEKLEAKCPGQVSCADIVALAAKVSVAPSGGPDIQIPLGRKDSTTSSRQAADVKIPPSNVTVDTLLDIFKSKSLNLEESVAIMGNYLNQSANPRVYICPYNRNLKSFSFVTGAHTLGGGHCLNIVDRLFDRQPDDQINPGFGVILRLLCPTKTPLTNLTVVPNDKTPLCFDNQYYRDVLLGNGLFTIDSRISTDQRTAPIVRQFAADSRRFFRVFTSAFVKLSSSNVLTNEEGQVRRKCNQVN